MGDVLGYEGRRVVVTGSASGMGQAATEILVSLGAEVYGLDVKSTTTSGAKSLEVDLRDRSAIEQAVAVVGTDVLGVFNCAGLPGPPF